MLLQVGRASGDVLTSLSRSTVRAGASGSSSIHDVAVATIMAEGDWAVAAERLVRSVTAVHAAVAEQVPPNAPLREPTRTEDRGLLALVEVAALFVQPVGAVLHPVAEQSRRNAVLAVMAVELPGAAREDRRRPRFCRCGAHAFARCF